jgi:hypothetical protein
LGALIASSQQNYQCTAIGLVIDSIAGSIIDSHLRNSLAHRLDIALISRRQAFDSYQYPRTRLDVGKAVQPISEDFSFANLPHGLIVARRLHVVKIFRSPAAIFIPASSSSGSS